MPPSASDARRARPLYLVLAGLVPCLVVAWANFTFTRNHFYANGPYIHDAGWFSHVAYRQGIYPTNPPIAELRPHYFSFHVSLLVAVFSLLSYAFPGDRVDWYCLCQAAVYLPIGAVIALLVPGSRRLTSVAGITVVGLTFAFNGLAFSCMGFPHYEILIATGTCVMLAGLATNRSAVAWTGIALAVMTREDGGAHAATFLVAVLACDLLGRPFPAPRRRVLVMTLVAALSSLLMMAVQKRVFHATSLFEAEYLGHPVYGHITGSVLTHRLSDLLGHSLFVVLPLGATLAIAIADRDGRWLLGWAVTMPWFVLNFLAHQELKARFEIYTGFPFIGSLLWVGAYGIVKYRGQRLPLVLGAIAGLSGLSAIGRYAAWPEAFTMQASQMAFPRSVDAPAIRRYARALRADSTRYGRIMVDSSVAAWATESLPADAVTHGDSVRSDYASYDAFTFFRYGPLGPGVHNILTNGRYVDCGELPRTPVFFCGHRGVALPPGFVPVSFLKRSLFGTEYVRREANGDLVVRASPGQKLGIYGPFARLAAGRYRAIFGIRLGDCPSVTDPRAEVEVFANNHVLGTGTLREPSGRVTIDFDAPASRFDAVELRSFTGACPYTVESVDLAPLLAEVGIPQ
ncbi:MAG TPA: hypothetical protein VLT33_14970 [Labilithrix sp.]|nr:hypothetical protein [Labilithrix sp.]